MSKRNFRAIIDIEVSDEDGLWVTLRTNKWEGMDVSDPGINVVEEAPLENLVEGVNEALTILMQGKSPWEEEQGTCPKCGQAFAAHNDDGSCVED